MTDSTEPDPRSTLLRCVYGGLATHALAVAIKLELADEWGSGAREPDELARTFGIDPARMVRLLRALAALGLCVQRSASRFELTEAGAMLGKHHPSSLHDLAEVLIQPPMLTAWSRLDLAVSTGRTAFDAAHGKPFYNHLAENPELSSAFNRAMSQDTRAVASALPDSYLFPASGVVIDVGGGDGTLLVEVLRRHPGLRGVVFDSAEGLAQAGGNIEQAGLGGRCTTSAGDFFDSVPGDGDLYLLKSIMHGWEDDRAVAILRRCGESLPPHGRLLIIEPVLPDVVDPAGSADPYLADLNMLAMTGGGERTRGDYAKLCARAGLAVLDVRPLPPRTGYQMVEVGLS